MGVYCFGNVLHATHVVFQQRCANPSTNPQEPTTPPPADRLAFRLEGERNNWTLTPTEGGFKNFFHAEKVLHGEGFIACCSAALAAIYQYGICGCRSIRYIIMNLPPPPPIELDHEKILGYHGVLQRQWNSSFNAACGAVDGDVDRLAGIFQIQEPQGTLAQAMSSRCPPTTCGVAFYQIDRKAVEPIIAMAHSVCTPVLLVFKPNYDETIQCYSLPASQYASANRFIEDGGIVISVSNESTAAAASAYGFTFDPITGTATRRTLSGVVERITFMHRQLSDNPNAAIPSIEDLNDE